MLQVVPNRRELIIEQIEDMVANFVYFDRKENERLPAGSIEAAVRAGEITVSEIATIFGDRLASVIEQMP